MKAKLENEVNMDLKSSKISPREPQHETNMDPKCTPKGALEASKRPLGTESGFGVLFGVILDPPKSSKMELKFDQQSSADLVIYFWLHFGLQGASCHFYKK